MVCLMTDDLDRSTRPRRPARSWRVSRKRTSGNRWDGMGWAIGRHQQLLRVLGPWHCHRPTTRRPPVVLCLPAGGSFIHSCRARHWDRAQERFLLRLLVGGYGASAVSCPRRKIKLNPYKILSILEKTSLRVVFYLHALHYFQFHGRFSSESVGSTALHSGGSIKIC